jgi:hypothetical protein
MVRLIGRAAFFAFELFFVITLSLPGIAVAAEKSSVLRSALSYLNDINEIAWVDIEDNNVYIGWKSIPPDFSVINRGAAFQGNKALDFGVHVWSVKAAQRGWRPGAGPYLCETTARYGKVQDSSCR